MINSLVLLMDHSSFLEPHISRSSPLFLSLFSVFCFFFLSYFILFFLSLPFVSFDSKSTIRLADVSTFFRALLQRIEIHVESFWQKVGHILRNHIDPANESRERSKRARKLFGARHSSSISLYYSTAANTHWMWNTQQYYIQLSPNECISSHRVMCCCCYIQRATGSYHYWHCQTFPI